MRTANGSQRGEAARQAAGRDPYWPSLAALAAATVGIVLSPYLTTTLPHRRALVVQAGLILLFTAVAAVVAAASKTSWRRVLAAPAGVRLGMLLYAGTAIVAATVGLLRGNETGLVAGQLLSMGLLPLGFVAAAAAPAPLRTAAFAWSLAGAAGCAALIHFGHWGFMLHQGQQLMRLYMGNSVSLTGVSLLALLVAVGLAAATTGIHRRIATLLAGLVALFIVGSGTRSLWIATVLGLGLLAVAVRAWRTLAHRRTRRILAVVSASAAATAAGVWLWWHWPRPNLLPDADTMAAPFWRTVRGAVVGTADLSSGQAVTLSWRAGVPDKVFALTQPLRLPGRRLYRISGWLRTDGTGMGRLGVAVLASPRPVCDWHVPGLAAADGWTEIHHAFGLDGDLMIYLVAGTGGDATGTWSLANVRVEDVGPAFLALAARQLEYLAGRFRTTVDVLEEGPEAGDENAAFRLKETLAVWRQFTAASPATVLFGHGLGARYQFGAWGWSDTGQRVFVDQPNYIHNFYAFLLFKTGVVGTAAVMSALILWLAALRRAQQTATAPRERHLAAAGFAALAAYAVWSLVCPEILDFRVAPLWGFVLGSSLEQLTSARETPGESTAS